MNIKNILVYFYNIYNGDQYQIYQALKYKKRVEPQEIENYFKICNINVNDYITVIELGKEKYEQLGRMCIVDKKENLTL